LRAGSGEDWGQEWIVKERRHLVAGLVFQEALISTPHFSVAVLSILGCLYGLSKTCHTDPHELTMYLKKTVLFSQILTVRVRSSRLS
jgi:hypothetical protein